MKQKILLLVITLIIVLSSCNKNNKTTSSISGIGDITVNPYGFTPLSAVYKISSINATPITVTVKGQHGEEDLIHTYSAGYGNEFEIHGLYPECNNTIIVNDGGRIINKNVYIGPISVNGINIPSKFTVELDNLPEEKYPNNPDIYFIGIYPYSIGISRNGYLKYINNKFYFLNIKVDNKQILLYDQNNGINTLIGKQYLKFPNTIKAHHDYIKKINGYLSLSYSTWGGEDCVSEIDSIGNIIKTYQISDLIKSLISQNNASEIENMNKIIFDDENIYTEGSSKKQIDWFHANSLVYDSDSDILYISGRHRGVLAIDYSEWKLIWWMADQKLNTKIGVGNGFIPYNLHFKDLPSLEPYRVKGDALNDGPKNQHALFLLSNGNLAMFDNQGDEDYNPNGSRYVEYQITGEHGNWQAKKIEDYRPYNLYSRVTSDVDYVGDKYENILMTYGFQSGNIIEFNKQTKNILFKLNVGNNFLLYRTSKLPFYYNDGRIYSEDSNLKN
ncbi:aryl-sulfate sulfotransferase [Brachyspira pulli]|uniref:aryl-sulfate sulfotransferase n=1 Tax=Brachyspira pulli TaxID=310721 RepID=UPI003005980D